MKKTINCSTPIEYKILSGLGKPCLILKRKKGAELTVPCPFCAKEHQHGTGDGHRVAHCPSRDCKEFVTADDGTVLYQDDGYIVVTV